MPSASTTHELVFHETQSAGLGRVSAAARIRNQRRELQPRKLDCYALVYLTEGSGWLRTTGKPRTDVKAGDAFLLFPGVRHSYAPSPHEGWSELYILFEGSVFDLWHNQRLIDTAQPMFHLEPVSIWEERIVSVWKEEGTALDRVVRMQELLGRMLRTRERIETKQERREWLDEARHLLSQNINDPHGVETAARGMGMSYQVFRKTFSRLHGCGPSHYQAEQRILSAARRLLTEITPIKQIADELGFTDEFHFSKRFKQHLGISPGAYRRRMVLRD